MRDSRGRGFLPDLAVVGIEAMQTDGGRRDLHGVKIKAWRDRETLERTAGGQQGRTEGGVSTDVAVVPQRRPIQRLGENVPGPGAAAVPDSFPGQRTVLKTGDRHRLLL